jgi:hypothetical protein
MARIRSVHPGLFTDEAFMSASPLARLLMIGLWTEAWDDGVFEWKPIVIKARLFPADACDVVALLDELSALHVIKRVERSGKAWGLIRNFRKFQRPKKPNSSGIAIADDVEFLGPDHVSSEPVPNQFRTSSEILPQMEDGGWRMEEKKKEKPSVLERAEKPAPTPRKVSTKARGNRLDESWSPSDVDRQSAIAEGMPPSEVDRTAARFRDYWLSKPGAAGVKLDWAATWRNWVRSDCEKRGWTPISQPATGPPPTNGWRPGLPTDAELRAKYARLKNPEPDDDYAPTH